MNEFPELWPHQVETYATLKAWAKEFKKLIIYLPTGGGKTLVAMFLVRATLLKGKRVCFVCDRTALIDQTCAVADRLGIPYGVMQAQHPLTDASKNFQICSAQTMARRKWPHFDVIIVDEAHCLYKSWTKHVEETDAFVIGLSASPFSKGLKKLFHKIVNSATMAELTEGGYLTPMRVFSCVRPDMAGAETANGEWTPKAVEERGRAIIGDVVKEWAQYAYGQKTFIFGGTIKHCEELCGKFNDAGILAAVYCSETPDEERREIMQEFRRSESELMVLLSVACLEKGVDCPEVTCIGDARPLRESFSTFIQMIGRGLRAFPGKTHMTLLDFSGNILRFREDFEDLYYNGLGDLLAGEVLDKKIRQEPDEAKDPCKCPKCGSIPFYKRCVACGHEKVVQSMIEHDVGVMKEILVGKRVAASNKEDLWAQACTYTRKHGKPETAHGRALYIYESMAGELPPKHWRHEKTPDVEISKATLGKIRSQQIRYVKGLEAQKRKDKAA